MFDGALSSGEKRQSGSPSGYSRPLMDETADAGRSAVCEQDSCTDSTSYSFTTSGGEQHPEILGADSTATLFPQGLITIVDAASKTLKRSWFWYSIAASLCWTAWAFTARLGSKEIPPATMQFVSAFGFLLVGLVMVAVQRPQLKKGLRGNSYALISGVLLGLGGIALYGAYRAGDNVAVVTATTSLYPVATVLLAVTFLREKLNKLQFLGVCFAVAAILLLSF
jgi:bacterial/archaeal transporter family protein